MTTIFLNLYCRTYVRTAQTECVPSNQIRLKLAESYRFDLLNMRLI